MCSFIRTIGHLSPRDPRGAYDSFSLPPLPPAITNSRRVFFLIFFLCWSVRLVPRPTPLDPPDQAFSLYRFPFGRAEASGPFPIHDFMRAGRNWRFAPNGVLLLYPFSMHGSVAPVVDSYNPPGVSPVWALDFFLSSLALLSPFSPSRSLVLSFFLAFPSPPTRHLSGPLPPPFCIKTEALIH